MTEEEAKARAIAWMAEPWDGGPFEDALAALLLSVAAEQRERDAVVCECQQVQIAKRRPARIEVDDTQPANLMAQKCAAAIRGES